MRKIKEVLRLSKLICSLPCSAPVPTRMLKRLPTSR